MNGSDNVHMDLGLADDIVSESAMWALAASLSLGVLFWTAVSFLLL